MGNLISDYIFKKNGKGVKRLRSNYSRVKSMLSELELENLTKAGMRSYLRYWVDTFRLNKWSKDYILKTTTVVNEYLLRDPIKDRRGCLVVLPHAGNWDHAAAYFCSTGINLTTVAEKLKPEAIFLKFLAHRESIGIEVLHTEQKVMPILLERLNQGKLVALVADRDLSKSGVEVDFINGIAKMPSGPARLILDSEAAFISAYITYTKNGINIEFKEIGPKPTAGSEEEKVKSLTQLMANNFAEGIKSAPVDWHMLQRIWVDEKN
ncbi:MAG: phosphatidylinositol mannoside acyltransferase [Actinobacteria bacterium]|nr:phosphatidylinositol mannoside acyltransferase [Actinomycetota bacterium]